MQRRTSIRSRNLAWLVTYARPLAVAALRECLIWAFDRWSSYVVAASPTEAVPSVPHHRSPCTASCPPPFLFSSSLATSLPVSDYPVFSLIFSLTAFLCSHYFPAFSSMRRRELFTPLPDGPPGAAAVLLANGTQGGRPDDDASAA